LFSKKYRFIYGLEIKKDGYTDKANMVLDIDSEFAKFYDYEYLRTDSLRKATKENLQAYTELDQLLSRKVNSSQNNSMFTMGYDYLLVKSEDKIDWKTEKESKKEGNSTLYKATTKYGSRQWTAWYNSEIPFQEGPYKFHGLPGLIFEIYDNENIYHYTLLQSHNLSNTFNTSDFLETHSGKKPISINLKQYHKIKLDYYNNIGNILNKYNDEGVSIATEKDIKSKEDIYNQIKIFAKTIKR
jgi:GLPGLI family protein